ncbi:hypothetical protein NDU88_001856 [Pleurodeles waltl]|uniref:Uncharacterized protein n=1 Tax=Pleurodeles waltl TaxID=8319 RepID=A0AAV7P746_PLEWA|nr:hypothetical protein NDU88_001856 [Pleurodeles waltl]
MLAQIRETKPRVKGLVSEQASPSHADRNKWQWCPGEKAGNKKWTRKRKQMAAFTGDLESGQIEAEGTAGSGARRDQDAKQIQDCGAELY